MLADHELDKLAARLPEIKVWIVAVEAMLVQRIADGVDFDNAEIVPTRPMRSWADEEQALQKLSKFLSPDEVAPRKLLSPAQAEKAVGKATFRDAGLVDLSPAKSSGMRLSLKEN